MGYGYSDFEITKREIVVSITIIALLLLLGLFISSKITEAEVDANEKYNKAIHITDTELFQYGMDTNVGNAFVYGSLEAIDTVTYPEIKGAYMYVEKETQKYTKHYRTETYYTGSGKTRRSHTRQVSYWTWDTIDSESKTSKEVTFAGIVFATSKINLPSKEYIDTISGGYHIRYEYHGIGTEHSGTIFAYLTDGTIKGNNNRFYEDCTTQQAYKASLHHYGEVFFWIIWIIFIIGCVVGFYFLDNNWLNN